MQSRRTVLPLKVNIVLTGKHCVYWCNYDVFWFLTGLARSC